MFTLFAIVVVGYVSGRLGYMGGIFDKRLSKLVIDISCPALILSSAMSGELPDRRFILPLLAVSLFTYVVLTAVALVLCRLLAKDAADRGVLAFAMIFGNVGFMGYPVVASIFGSQAVFYAAVLNVVNTFAVFTVGTMLVTGGSAAPRAKLNRKVLYGTPMLAAYAAMLIVALGVTDIPAFVSEPLAMIGNITVPAALLIIGSSMSHLPLRSLAGTPAVHATSVLRLVLLPVAMHYLCLMLGFERFVVGINTVVIAMPVATYGTILCLRYGRDTTLMAEVTFVTTLLSMVTIPLLVTLL
jgi:predicted permease